MKHLRVLLFLSIPLFLAHIARADEAVVSLQDKALQNKATEARRFAQKHGLSTEWCVLINMKIPSGKNRLFLWNFKTASIERPALCAHGSGKGEQVSTEEMPLFSNQKGSLLTSLGKYKIGKRAPSQWGINIHYKLHGLEETNRNAFARIVVLHSHSPLPKQEIHPEHLPLGWSWGCPVTDDDTMVYLDKKLQVTKQPVLLWIYYE